MSASSTGATQPTITYQRALVFNRVYPVPPVANNVFPRDKQLVYTFPFDTDDDKAHFVEFMFRCPEDFGEFFDSRCPWRTRIIQHEDDVGNDRYGGTNSLQFYKAAQGGNLIGDVPHHYNIAGDENSVYVSVTFPVDTRAQQLSFARWIEEKRFDDFLHGDAHMYFSNIVTVSEEPQAPSAERGALRTVSDALFEHKETMPEATYVALSNALKRSHEQI